MDRSARMARLVAPAVGGLILCICVAHAAAQGPPATPVRVDVVRREMVVETRMMTGELRAVRRSAVASLEGGRVVELPVVEGDSVVRGAILARLDDRRLRLAERSAQAMIAVKQAMLAEREAQVEQAKRDETKLLGMLADSSAAQNEYDDAVTNRIAAEARRDQATADLVLAEVELALIEQRLEDMTITAPFAGEIVSKRTDVGEWIGEGNAVVDLVAGHQLEAWLDVPQEFCEAVSGEGIVIPIVVRASDRRLEPVAPRVIRQVDRIARTFSLVVPIEQELGAMAPGMSVAGWVPTGKQGEHITLPRDALLPNAAGFFVYKVTSGPDGARSVVPTQVDIAFEFGDAVALRGEALEPGDLVVTEGNERLFPTAPVKLINDVQTTAQPEGE
ncbi:MAG: efflux RND transporter periplasmic adaptor subunit [Phycisphaerales bacterium]|nr:efflux RND transporter periplasmic adaptor subunit [Phycisphaerales bacterium]